MDIPDGPDLRGALRDLDLPTFYRVRYDPPTPTLTDVEAAAEAALESLALDGLPDGAEVAVGLGSRGITDIVSIAGTVIEGLQERGFEPVVVPAMGSHGGATPDGQRRTLGELGLDEETLGCPIDPSMETTVVGTTEAGWPVHVASRALEADGWLVVNRVKPHTNFTGRIESGLCKMATIGIGKQSGAQTLHEYALREGYVDSITAALEVVRTETAFLGGIGIVENFAEEVAEVAGIPAEALPTEEEPLLDRAREYMPTLPYHYLDVLVVDEIGKDVSGAGMDTNVIGRYRVLNAEDPETPDIKRIAVLGTTDATHGNGQGIGLADVTTKATAETLDLQQMYTNALTSGSLSKSALPMVLPDDESALLAALGTIGPYDPATVRVAWIRDTEHLTTFLISEALLDPLPEHVTVAGEVTVEFDGGAAKIRQSESR